MGRNAGQKQNHAGPRGHQSFGALPDDEKAAALDAAIEYEDALPATHNQTSNIQKSQRDTEMDFIDGKDMQELNEAAAGVKAAQDRFRAACRRIGGQEPMATEGTETQDKPAGSKARRHTGTGRGHRPPVEGDLPAGQVQKKPWKKIACSVCSEIFGQRIYQGQAYPILHKDPGTGQPCKGSFAVGVAVDG